MKREKVLITSALPYANGPLHFGHIAGAYLPGDCYARFERLQGKEVLYICGSDEHGVAITMSAELAGRTPQEQVDHYHHVIVNLFEKLNFSFDHFSRTTWRGHVQPTQQFFLDLVKQGYIEERVTDQLYSIEEDKFLADRYVIGSCPKCGYEKARGDECPDCGASYEATDLIDPKSKLSGSVLSKKKTKHWFLRLDLFKERLLEWIDEKNWKSNVVKFTKGYIRDLRPRAITRDSKWGVPLPIGNSEGKVFYVWFDAPIGYISATMEWAKKVGDPESWRSFWCEPTTKLVQFIGKDNIPFHAAIFPAMIMGQTLPYKLVDELPANEFYKLEGRQFSTSEGWLIDLDDFFLRYTSDQIRYVIAATAPETADSEFTWKEFQQRCNSELLGKYGNLINRVLVFAHKHCLGKVPSKGVMEEEARIFLQKVEHLIDQAKECYETFRLRRACQVIMELAQLGNVYFNNTEPWKKAKEGDIKGVESIIACCLECLKALALISSPIIPQTAQKVWKMLGYTDSLEALQWDQVCQAELSEGQSLKPAEILFIKIEDQQIKEEIAKLHKMADKHQQKATFPISKKQVDIDAVSQLDLRVATILAAEPIKKSKKLYKVEVDLGTEKRIIVSGIKPFYTQEELIGKKVVVIVNLQPATLCGVESNGMLLAASSADQLQLLSVDDLPNGSVVS